MGDLKPMKSDTLSPPSSPAAVSATNAAPPLRLLDQVRARIRVKHYSIRTEEAYVDWIKRYIKFHDKRHPRELSAAHVERFLSYLATERDVAASTQNQAKSALLFLYKEVLGVELPWLDGVTQARVPKRLPVVLTRAEVARVLARIPAGVREERAPYQPAKPAPELPVQAAYVAAALERGLRHRGNARRP